MISFALVAICYSFFPAPSIGSFMGRLNAELVALSGGRAWGMDGQREIAGRMRRGGVSHLHPGSPSSFAFPCLFLSSHLVCLLISSNASSSCLRILILSPICICHLTSYSASHSFCSGHSIVLIVALALRRPEWTCPCSSNLAISLHLCCIVYWPCHPFLGSHFHHTALPLLHGLSSLLPHGCCRWWL